MKILLVNPPNSGRSIPEERYGIDSLKQIFRSEPLALEVLAATVPKHEVALVDLKAAPDQFDETLHRFQPDLVGFTAMTCEANRVIELARQVREQSAATIVVGGIHASNAPEDFNRPEFDYVAIGLGHESFPELIQALEQQSTTAVAGIAAVMPGKALQWKPRQPSDRYSLQRSPRYDLTAVYRDAYFLPKLNVQLGCVVTAYGCPYQCHFCSIAGQNSGRYLNLDTDQIIRDLQQLEDIPFIRLVDANSFGNPRRAQQLADQIAAAGLRKQFLADARADSVVRHPGLFEQWRNIGLRSLVIGFEEISDRRLNRMNKQGNAAVNEQALNILRDMGITVVGDFIVDTDYEDQDFDQLERYIVDHPINLPMLTIMTPLPGTPLYAQMRGAITEHNLDYYTLTNAVVKTAMPEQQFYTRYADLLRTCHAQARI
ncbi:MAG: cobalamin-dependent protein [Desulfuromonadaceae bacterium]|nr:cobalamin-dependent protein [Desulfuromonadaceae bacterium]